MKLQDWYIIQDIEQFDTPALVVYPDRVKQNIALVKSMIDDVSRLRPHVKTYKNEEVTLLMVEAGINKFKCATIAEAEMLGMCKAPDVLLAYQPVGPKLSRLTKICLDLGHKSVAAEKEISKRVFFLNAPELVMLGQSEEHLVAEAGNGHKYKVGDVLYGLTYHICPTVALYELAITIENNKVSGEWRNIARDRKITI